VAVLRDCKIDSPCRSKSGAFPRFREEQDHIGGVLQIATFFETIERGEAFAIAIMALRTILRGERHYGTLHTEGELAEGPSKQFDPLADRDTILSPLVGDFRPELEIVNDDKTLRRMVLAHHTLDVRPELGHRDMTAALQKSETRSDRVPLLRHALQRVEGDETALDLLRIEPCTGTERFEDQIGWGMFKGHKHDGEGTGYRGRELQGQGGFPPTRRAS
jgi:hypothetical protein